MASDNSNKRGNIRHLISVPIRVVDSKGLEFRVMTDNLSDCGLFLLFDEEPLPDIGEIVTVQVMHALGDGEEAPINKAEVVRHAPGGIGLTFIFDD